MAFFIQWRNTDDTVIGAVVQDVAPPEPAGTGIEEVPRQTYEEIIDRPLRKWRRLGASSYEVRSKSYYVTLDGSGYAKGGFESSDPDRESATVKKVADFATYDLIQRTLFHKPRGGGRRWLWNDGTGVFDDTPDGRLRLRLSLTGEHRFDVGPGFVEVTATLYESDGTTPRVITASRYLRNTERNREVKVDFVASSTTTIRIPTSTPYRITFGVQGDGAFRLEAPLTIIVADDTLGG